MSTQLPNDGRDHLGCSKVSQRLQANDKGDLWIADCSYTEGKPNQHCEG